MNRLGQIIFYVDDVEKTIEFYERAFGLSRWFIDPTKRYGELKTGQTALGFASMEMASLNFPGGFKKMSAQDVPTGCEVTFLTDDVEASFAQALKAGATAVAAPSRKEWGQTVGYVRDPNGIVIEIGSEMQGCHVDDAAVCCDHCD